MKNHFDISGSIKIHEVDIAGVACIMQFYGHMMKIILQDLHCASVLLNLLNSFGEKR